MAKHLPLEYSNLCCLSLCLNSWQFEYSNPWCLNVQFPNSDFLDFKHSTLSFVFQSQRFSSLVIAQVAAVSVEPQPDGSAASAVEDMVFKFLAQQQVDALMLDQAFRGTYDWIEDTQENRCTEHVTREYGCKADGSTVTVKRFRDANVLAALGEILTLQRCRHPHIVRLLDVCSAGESPRFVFSQFGQPVQDVKLEPAEVAAVCPQVLDAINYMHSLSIAHLDIRAANVTVRRQPGATPVAVHAELIDFACSRLLRPGCQSPLNFGTRPLDSRAPEVLLRGPVALETDIWGLGVVLAHMGLGRAVWVGSSDRSVVRAVLKALGPPSAAALVILQSYPGWQASWAERVTRVEWGGKIVSRLGESYLALILAMLQWTPSERLSGPQALQHSFFTTGPAVVAATDVLWGSGCELATLVEREGFVVLPGLVKADLCERLIQEINARVAHLLSLYQISQDETCSGLLQGGKLFDKSPPGWLADGAELPFGPCRHRAWISTVGSGRLFEGTFSQNSAAVAVQEAVRHLMAKMLQVTDTDALVRVPERVSVKPAGSKGLRPHLDCNRWGTYQVVISLCQTRFSLFPGSHRVSLDCWETSKYHELDAAEMAVLEEAGVSQKDIAAGPGDVLVMQGGRVVHSSPAVAADEATRYMAYAHYELVAATGV